MDSDKSSSKRRTSKKETSVSRKTKSGNPVVNILESTPTSEDLRRFYYWENRRRGGIERGILAEKRRLARLKDIWHARWQGRCQMRVDEKKSGITWRRAFAVIQGHRMCWWGSERKFDDGEDCEGQMFFSGHSGLGGLSPFDLRVLDKDEYKIVTTVFGRGGAGDQSKKWFKFETAKE